MAFTRPKLSEIIERIENDVQNKIGGNGAPLRRSIVKILSRAIAGVIHSLYGFLNWVSRQLFVTSAEDEQLDRHGIIWGIDRKAATYAYGLTRFTGDPSELIPIGTILQNSAGVEYQTTEQGTIAGTGFVDVQIRAVLAGADANCDSGVALTLTTAIPFINSETIVQGVGISGGAYIENDEDYRSRILFRLQNPPQGGSKSDYIIWATEASNVTDAWCFPLQFGAGTVLVTVANYNNSPPIVADLTEVSAIIEEKRPVTASVTVSSVIESPIDLNISLNPNNQTTRDNVTAQIKDLLKRRGFPGGQISPNNFGEAIGTAGGVIDYSLNAIYQNGLLVSYIQNNPTQISVSQNLTFTDL